MYRIKSLTAFTVSCILIMIVLAGCATSAVSPPVSPPTDTDIVRPSWLDSSWKIMYSPQIHPGKSVDDVLADMGKYLATNDVTVAYKAQASTQYYSIQRLNHPAWMRAASM